MIFFNSEKSPPPSGAGGGAGTCESEPERRWSPVVAGAAQMLEQISGEIPKQISNLIPNQEYMKIQDLLSKQVMLAVRVRNSTRFLSS